MPDLTTADAFRQWARGVELLLTASRDALLDGPWIHHDDRGGRWFDPDLAKAEAGHLSGGQRRVLAIAPSLASSNHPVDLGDAVTGMDPHAAMRDGRAGPREWVRGVLCRTWRGP